MRIAYFSPLCPQRSGIADYSEELLPHLAAGAEVELFVDGFRPANESLLSRFRWHDYGSRPGALDLLGGFDAAVYHMGNDHRYHAGIYDAARRRPGVLVLHDYSLQNFFAGLARQRGDWRAYLDELEFSHGRAMRAEAERALARGATPAIHGDPVAFPLNRRLVTEAEGVIVHSEWARSRLALAAPAAAVRQVNHHVLPDAPVKRPRGGDDAAPRRVEIASFGHITGEKGVERVLRALSALRARHDFHYTLVGQPDHFDPRGLARAAGLADRVTITGYVPLDEFRRRIAAADIVVNLRERTVGETSGSVCRAMAAGLPVVVSNVGWFAELPDDAAVKIDPGPGADASLLAHLERLLGDEPLRRRLGENARRYVHDAHAIDRSAAGYLDFIRETVRLRQRRLLIRRVSAELAALGVGDEDEILRGVAAEVARIAPKGGA
jgi:glycosyltransferase involved in cell wall biosynthesis